MARINYNYEKRAKEIAKKQKRDEKIKRRQQGGAKEESSSENESSGSGEVDTVSDIPGGQSEGSSGQV